jgi:hypothetical protein
MRPTLLLRAGQYTPKIQFMGQKWKEAKSESILHFRDRGADALCWRNNAEWDLFQSMVIGINDHHHRHVLDKDNTDTQNHTRQHPTQWLQQK